MPGRRGTKSAAFAIAIACMALPGMAAAHDIEIQQEALRKAFVRVMATNVVELQSCAPTIAANQGKPYLNAMKSRVERLNGEVEIYALLFPAARQEGESREEFRARVRGEALDVGARRARKLDARGCWTLLQGWPAIQAVSQFRTSPRHLHPP
jgi:hypothetical protein